MAVVPRKLPLIQAVSKGCNGSICDGRARWAADIGVAVVLSASLPCLRAPQSLSPQFGPVNERLH